MFVDPIEDMKPVGALAESWFVISNLRAGDREFGILVHHLKSPLGVTPAITITDVSTGKFFLDESAEGKLTATDSGFVVKADNLQWSASATEMHIQAQLKSGESFDLKTRRVGPALAYNGTGYFPLIDNALPTWEFAFPTMETVGTVTIGKETLQVTGNSWFDRQWFRSLGKLPEAHWTWIATRLPNGDVLAVWDAVGERERAWANIMRPDGTVTVADVELLSQHVSGLWTSARSGITWPSEWAINIPGTRTQLTVKSTSQGQETFEDLPRLESVVHISGVYEGQDINSVGYAEMVGDPKLAK